MFEFIKGITGKRDAERARHREATAALIAKGQTQEQAFAQLYVSDAAEEAITEIQVSKRGSHLITRMALAMSMPHQIGFFLSIARPHFEEDPLQWVHPVSIIAGAILAPLIVDLTIMYFVRLLTMKVAAASSKLWAFAALILPVAASAYVNFAVPAPHPILNYVFGGAVLFIPLVYGYLAFFKVNFGQLLQLKEETLAQVAAPAVEANEVDEQAKARRSEIARKAAAKRRENAAKLAADKAAKLEARRERAAAKKLAELAPTSPGHPAVMLSAADKEALAHLAAKR